MFKTIMEAIEERKFGREMDLCVKVLEVLNLYFDVHRKLPYRVTLKKGKIILEEKEGGENPL